eukprot:TRINITY_DN6116_c0_g4_i1.p1 TRINITY_DN6116_c0_g4~~TRINITY_DN6116_c0_g4_i1.p1  ORF type:complete len:354 (+),score=75.06 TRINITY_DN6116_c0_g4_i1:84-1064(+)
MPRLEAALLAFAQLAFDQAAAGGGYYDTGGYYDSDYESEYAAVYEAAAYSRGDADHAPAANCTGQAGYGFIHIPKCGGTGMLESLNSCCLSQSLKNAKILTSLPRGWSYFWFHSSAFEQRRVVGDTVWNRAYTFAIVRNPWDKQISRFFFRAEKYCTGSAMDRKGCEAHRFHRDKTELGPQEFQHWVHFMYESYPPGSPQSVLWTAAQRFKLNFGSDYRGAAQWYWITDPRGRILVDDVYKLEQMEQNWPRLQSHICGLRTISYAEHKSHGRGLCADGRGCPEGVTAAAAKAPPRRRQDYYDNATRDIVHTVFKLDVDNFKYSFYD